MPRSPTTRACPCDSGNAFVDCCQPLLTDCRPAPSAEALMRSRYCAFALGYFDYLIETHDPDHRNGLNREELQLQDQRLCWLGLKVLHCSGGQAGDNVGEVSFSARYLEDDNLGELTENSQFRQHHGRWFYTTGEARFSALGKVGRNTECPCGSGKKFKRCHGK